MTLRPSPSLRVVLAYGLAACLLCLLDAGRFSRMLDRLSGEIPEIQQVASLVQDVASGSGFTALTGVERRLFSSLTVQKIIGEIATPALSDADSAQTASPPPFPNESFARVLAEKPVTKDFQSDTKVQGGSTEASPQSSDRVEALPRLPLASQNEEPDLPRAKPKVLIVGDSMIMEGFGPVLHRTLRQRGDMDVLREGRYSTGLSRTDFFDWPECLSGLVQRDRPDLIIICMGANDGQDIIDANGKRHHADSASWGEIYRARADALLAIATAKGSHVLWVGLPIMGKQPYSKRIRRLSDLQKAACDAVPRATFVNTEAALADANGSYITFLTDAKGRHVRLRYKDMVHVSEDGGKLLTESVVPYIEAALRFKEPSGGSGGSGGSGISGASAATIPIPSRMTAVSASAGASGALGTPVNQTNPALPGRRELHFFSKARNQEVAYEAFVPEDARPDERFPALYLLHGADEDSRAWGREMADILPGLASSLRVVLIAPSCGRYGWYLDSPLVASNQMESFFIEELLPHAEANLPLSQKRSALGISMGGHGAFVLALRHPGVFTSVSSMSGVLDITRHPAQWGIRSLLGPFGKNPVLWEEYSVLRLLERIPQDVRLPSLLVTTGRNDDLVLQENRAVRDVLRRRGALYQYRETPGNHDWAYWRGEMPQHVAFHGEQLQR